MKTHIANAIDTNQKPVGLVKLQIETYPDGRPLIVEHKGFAFFATTKMGTNIATGKTVYELANTDNNTDKRIWVSSDLSNIYED